MGISEMMGCPCRGFLLGSLTITKVAEVVLAGKGVGK